MGIVESKEKYKTRQKADIVYGIGTVLAGFGSLFIAISRLKRAGIDG